MSIRGVPLLMIGDRMVLEPADSADFMHTAQAIPSAMRFLPGSEAMNAGKSPAHAAAGNVLHALMCALWILSTRSAARETIAPSDKLTRARAKAKKPLCRPMTASTPDPTSPPLARS